MREDVVFQPVSGRAMPIYKGEVLRIMQEAGGQCVDFNCFNLHDYKEYMSVGHTRRQGIRVVEGDYVFSQASRSNLMMYILEMPATCITDLIGSRCSPELFEATWGFDLHTNCQDTLAECIGEYGLTPDNTHDSFNMWMYTGWDDRGRWHIRRNEGKAGDYVDLLAMMDVLAVPIVCGSGDITGISNFFLKPIRVQAFESSAETNALAEEHLDRWGRGQSQRTLEDHRIKEIQTELELVANPSYDPQFLNYPLDFQDLEMDLSAEDQDQIQRLVAKGMADDTEDAIRSMVMGWYLRNRSEPNPFSI